MTSQLVFDSIFANTNHKGTPETAAAVIVFAVVAAAAAAAAARIYVLVKQLLGIKMAFISDQTLAK
jgi:hypothetical protein